MSQKGPFGRPNFVFVYCGLIGEMVALLFANGGLNVVRNVVRNGKLSDLLRGLIEDFRKWNLLFNL